MKLLKTLVFSFFLVFGYSQQILDFEDFTIEQDSFLNGSDLSGGFTLFSVFLPNQFTVAYDSWSGWAISNTTDVTTPGFTNQYSSIVGSGNDGSDNYATTFVLGSSPILNSPNDAGTYISSLRISNSTYAALSMRDGDAFAKKFGGETGDDPDFFKLDVDGYFEGDSTGTVEYYLADFRFEDNTQDFILDTWDDLDLSSLGITDSLSFRLSSSDNGQFGMNTPAYFCIDDIRLDFFLSNDDIEQAAAIDIYPNPSTGRFTLEHELHNPFISIYNAYGSLIMDRIDGNKREIDLSTLPAGNYLITFTTKDQILSKSLVKL
jgi:hypothetical protein